MSLSAGDHLGPYEVLAAIGAGGMGEVYRARDPRLNREVAIKVAAERFSDRFEREAHAIASLNHPNICTLHDVGPNYLVMELVEGLTLAERIEQGALPLEEALGIARQIADALDAAHEKRVVHRDLKPGNIKLKPDGTVKVLDFGLAKLADDAPAPSSSELSPTLTLGQATRVGMILGTAAYMAPEQARGKPVDKRCDLWAFGVVLYEMLTGERLFKGEDVTEILASVVKDQPDLTRVPIQVRRLLERCLEKDPKKRLRDIGDAWEMLEKKSASSPDQPPLPPRSWLSWSLAALFLAIAAAVSGVHFLDRPAEPEVMRFQILPPEKTSFGDNFSLSPDGRKLAFSAPGPNGRPALWVRSLDAIESRLLVGTEGYDGGLAFWSPESRYLAFGAEGKLKKIDVSGGPAQTLCDVTSGVLGGGWNREGTIIFGGAAVGSPVWRVPAAGGTASPITAVDSVKEARHSLPSFLPDGRHFIYTRFTLNPAQSGVYVGSLDVKPDQQSSKGLLVSTFNAQYVSTSDSGARLLFLRDGTLMAQAFDASRLELSGEAVPVAERVGAYLNFGQFGASSNGVLVYRVGGGGANFHLTWYDRQGKPLGTAGPPAPYQMMALSPDRNRVAAMRTDAQSSFADIWLIDLARNIPTRLTFAPTTDIDPIWSRDGLQIVFQSNGIGLKRKLSSGGGTEEVLLSAKEQLHPVDVSPDGRFLLYSVLDPKTKSDLWVLPMEGDRKPVPYLKTPYDEGQGQFSPDGRWVAYRSEESGKSEIYVQPFPATAGGGGKWLVSSGGGAQPRWGRDGKELFYVSNEHTVMAVDVATSPTFKPGVPKPLFDAPFHMGAVNVFRWDVSADAKKFLIITTGQDSEVSPLTVVLNWPVSLKK